MSKSVQIPKPERPIRLVACDMDGTLLNSEFRLSPRTVETVRCVTRKGVYFVLVSGRMIATLRPFHQELGLTTPVIGYNGAMVRDLTSGETLSHTPIPYPIAEQVIAFAQEEGFHLQYFWDDRFFAVSRNPWLELYESRVRLKGEIVPDLREFGPDRPPTKMQIITDPETVRELVPLLQERFRPHLYVTRTLPEYVEMMHPEVSKGRALRELAGQLRVPREQIVVFGDAPNDLTMFEEAGLSIAVANGSEAVREQADGLTLSNDEDGVAVALEALGLCEEEA
ncbi:MAG: haloacid dehalogenase [Candidatus Poribacteria bacterium]|nr:MAG: haloacid dehalogenase [Candidatus Poribacteria bacterium]